MKGLNLSSFKKMVEDKHSATMIHKDGHKLVISKGSLPALHRKQLEALPFHQGEAQHFDEGGTALPKELADLPQSDPSALGVTAQQTPSVPAAPIDAAVAAPQAQMAPKDIQSQQAGAFEQEKAAKLESAEAEGELGRKESRDIGTAQAQIGKMPTQSDVVNSYKSKNDELFKHYQENKLDPNRYWQDHSKVAGIVGTLLSAAGQAMGSNQPNGALDVIQHGINRDIDLQKNSQEKDLNLWKMNREVLGSDLAANLATQNQMYTGLKYQLMKTAAESRQPLAIAKAHSEIAQINQRQVQLNALLGLHSGLTNQSGDGSEQSFIHNFNTAGVYAPELAKEAQAKYIPGVGVSRVPLTTEDRSSLVYLDNLEKHIDRGIDFAKTKGTTLPGTVKNQEAADIQNGIQLEIGNLVGLKRINEFEAKKYTDLAGNPGAFRTKAAIQSLEDLKHDIGVKRQAMASGLGITPFRGGRQQARQSTPSKPQTVIQNGHTYNLNPKTGQYE